MGAILDTLVERNERGISMRGYQRVRHAGQVQVRDNCVRADVERVQWTIHNGQGRFWRFFNDPIETCDYFFTDANTALHFKMRWR